MEKQYTLEIVGLSVSTQKATPNETPETIALTVDGISGDRHAGPGLRQVSIMAEEHAQAQLAEGETTVLPGVNKENILVRGLAGAPIAPLDIFTFGEVVLEVTEVGAHVSDWGKKLCPSHAPCGVTDYGIFTRVLQGGAISIGIPGAYQRRCMHVKIITLSDRAASGKYPDRSGPKIEELMRVFAKEAGWTIQLEHELIPDDAETLHNVLIEALSSGVDIILSTGGTGVSPRDCTPEVVLGLADKEMPGIMEHIRWKYGQDNPMAYLSRSVAVTVGETLIYTLPGSVKAVEEYMAEIVQTLEHLLLTLRGLQVH